jgi:hypothetical protein
LAGLAIVASALFVASYDAGQPRAAEPLRFEVAVAENLVEKPQDGRVLIVLSRTANAKGTVPKIGTGGKGTFIVGADAKVLPTGGTIVVEDKAIVYPVESLAKVPPGDYFAQPILNISRDIFLTNAPGNLYGEEVKVKIDPATGGVLKLKVSSKLPPEKMPADTANVKYVKVESKLLSQFHGRPMYLRAAVNLPSGFEKNPDKRYPLRVHIGGFGTRFKGGKGGGNGSELIQLNLDGAGPFGDPYQVNSANSGPYGDAITQELIPHVEKTYRGIGEPYGRVLDGHSTGGWVSFALQVFYPDFFNGCWSSAPDPVDFRSYQLVNIYEHDNAYLDPKGLERASSRNSKSGATKLTMRGEVMLERVIGRGDRWELGGRDWGSWNATFGPRGDDGLPKALWDGKTGKIDKSVLEHWKKYDLRMHLEKNWTTLAPKLRGKIRITVGEMDDYFLNNAVHLLDNFISKAQPPFEGRITFIPGAGHGFPQDAQKMVAEMAAAVERGKTAK